VSYSNRYLYLRPGGAGPAIRDGGTLARANVKTPVEVDQLVNHITPPVRAGIAGMIDSTAGVADQAAPDLNRTLRRTPALTRKLAGVFSDLIADKQSLRTLVGSTSNVVDAVDRANPELRVLLDGFARTADAVASESGAIEGFARHAAGGIAPDAHDRSACRGHAQPRCRPDRRHRTRPLRSLRKTSGPLTRTLTTLSGVTRWRSTRFRRPSRRASRAAPTSSRRSARSRRVSTSLAKQAATQIGCLRPYAPEIAAFGGTWGDWFSGVTSATTCSARRCRTTCPRAATRRPTRRRTPRSGSRGWSTASRARPASWRSSRGSSRNAAITKDALDPTKDKEGLSFRANQAAGRKR